MIEQRSPAVTHDKFFYLLISLLLLLLLHPFFTGAVVGRIIFDISFSIVLLSAVYAVSRKKHVFITGLVLVLFVFAGLWSTYVLGNTLLTLVGFTFAIPLFVLVASIVLSDVLRAEKVTADKIHGAICVYLLIGVIWAVLYSLIEGIQPGSFSVDQPQVHEENFRHFLYYSFVTLSTLGYGDIVPVTPPAKTFSYMEAVTGQIYIAVLIARLVGLHIAHSMKKDSQ